MRPILLKTGSTFDDLVARRGDFERWFATGLGWSLDRFHLIDAMQTEALPEPGSVDGVIVTGSPAAVHDRAPWSERAGRWLTDVVTAGIPVLAVCYGHQLLAHSSGGRTGKNPRGREIGVVEIELVAEDPLFAGLPRRFPVFATHSDAVLQLPAAARVLARNDHTEVQAFALGERGRGVQWHPEFDADVMRHYLVARAALIDAELGSGTARRLLAEVSDLPTGRTILTNFLTHYLAA